MRGKWDDHFDLEHRLGPEKVNSEAVPKSMDLECGKDDITCTIRIRATSWKMGEISSKDIKVMGSLYFSKSTSKIEYGTEARPVTVNRSQ